LRLPPTSIKSAISVARSASPLGGTVSDPGSDVQGPSADSVVPTFPNSPANRSGQSFRENAIIAERVPAPFISNAHFKIAQLAGAQKSSCDMSAGQMRYKRPVEGQDRERVSVMTNRFSGERV